jgi:Tfp pilus assembly protein PilN
MKPVMLRFDAGGPRPLLELLLGRSSGLPGRAALVVLALCVAYLLALGWQLAQARQEAQSIRQELLATLSPSHDAATARAVILTAEQRRAWNQVARQLNTPWAALLAGLETATPDDVALVSIEPDSRRGAVRLVAEAKSLEPLLAYVQALKAVEPFADAMPLRHETNEQDPNRPIRMTINVSLRERIAAEARDAGERP